MTLTPQISMNASRQWADRLGVWTSSLCVIHCILTPVLISSSAVLAHFLPAEERVHRSLALLVALFGAIALLFGFRKHGRRRILILMSAGLSCIAAAAWFGDKLPSHVYEVAITMVGSTLMITAHRLNHTFCRSCECSTRC
jgi:phage terminase large subunit-like protein